VLSEILFSETMSSQEVSANIAEMEETVTRISTHKGVEGVMIMNRQGVFEYRKLCFADAFNAVVT
jgi:hypothetical protein